MNDNHIISHYHSELQCELKRDCNLYVKFPDIDEYAHIISIEAIMTQLASMGLIKG